MAVNSYSYSYSSYKSTSITVTKNTKTDDAKTPALSDNAQKYLETLKSKYGNVNFVIKDYSNSEEAGRYLSEAGGNSEYNCIITPDLLEKMAADESVAQKYEGIISGAGEQLNTVKEQLGEDAEKVERYGISVNDKGEVSFFAILKQGLDKLNEAREKTDDKKLDKKDNDKHDKHDKQIPGEKYQTLSVKADTIESLVAAIKDAIAGKTSDKNKDGFAIEYNDKELWSKVGGKTDGFDHRHFPTSPHSANIYSKK